MADVPEKVHELIVRAMRHIMTCFSTALFEAEFEIEELQERINELNDENDSLRSKLDRQLY